jgi:predicted Zn-ribbon and HTH transcriptional regulator
MTRREDIIELLKEQEMTSQELAQHFETTKKSVLSDLKHIRKSLKNQEVTLAVKMPECKSCGFQFQLTSVKEPSTCPECRSTWIEPPVYRVIK